MSWKRSEWWSFIWIRKRGLEGKGDRADFWLGRLANSQPREEVYVLLDWSPPQHHWTVFLLYHAPLTSRVTHVLIETVCYISHPRRIQVVVSCVRIATRCLPFFYFIWWRHTVPCFLLLNHPFLIIFLITSAICLVLDYVVFDPRTI